MSGTSFVQAVTASFSESIGDIVFGMEDGTVSIFGLVFGVAASASNSQTVLLAGATGAAAVSMMAGTYLDVETARGQARAQLARERAEIAHEPGKEAKEVDERLRTSLRAHLSGGEVRRCYFHSATSPARSADSRLFSS